MSENFDAVTRHCWAMAQRVGTQIAELPVRVREVAFAGAETCLRAAGSELGVGGQQLDILVDLQMEPFGRSLMTLTFARLGGAKALSQRCPPLRHVSVMLARLKAT